MQLIHKRATSLLHCLSLTDHLEMSLEFSFCSRAGGLFPALEQDWAQGCRMGCSHLPREGEFMGQREQEEPVSNIQLGKAVFPSPVPDHSRVREKLGLREFLPAHSQCSGAFLHRSPAGEELGACPALV